MLLLDSTNLSVHEIDSDVVVMNDTPPPCVPFYRFEVTARSRFCSILFATQLPAFRVGVETLVFVKLTEGRGWAWASRIRVAHRGQWPINDKEIGEEFIFLWPVPMAIHAYLNFKERARRAVGISASSAAFVSAISNHPPSMEFVTQQSIGQAIGTTRELRAKDLTVAQRLFVASLAPHTTSFAARAPEDLWTEELHADDQRHLNRFLGRAGTVPADGAHSSKSTPAHHRRRRRRGCTDLFELPDDVVGRIACVHVSQCMAHARDMQAAAAQLRLISQQFRRATDAALQQLLRTVTSAASSLLGDQPREPSAVQAVVNAAGLTLRHALLLKGDWAEYVRARWDVEQHDDRNAHPVPAHSARERQRLLWDVHPS